MKPVLQRDSGSGVYDPVFQEVIAIVNGGTANCAGPFSRYAAVQHYRDWICQNTDVC